VYYRVNSLSLIAVIYDPEAKRLELHHCSVRLLTGSQLNSLIRFGTSYLVKSFNSQRDLPTMLKSKLTKDGEVQGRVEQKKIRHDESAAPTFADRRGQSLGEDEYVRIDEHRMATIVSGGLEVTAGGGVLDENGKI
jgi:hypothetical protein